MLATAVPAAAASVEIRVTIDAIVGDGTGTARDRPGLHPWVITVTATNHSSVAVAVTITILPSAGVLREQPDTVTAEVAPGLPHDFTGFGELIPDQRQDRDPDGPRGRPTRSRARGEDERPHEARAAARSPTPAPTNRGRLCTRAYQTCAPIQEPDILTVMPRLHRSARSVSDLAETIRAALAAAADPARAPGQQAYMKSAMPFYGVPLPEVRRLTKAAATGMTDAAALRATAIELWDAASRREERYAAMHLLGQRPLRADPEVIPIVEHMVRTGRWWDITDELAHRMAEALDARPAETTELVRRWSVDPDLWIRRIAILSQLGRRDRVDPVLLAAVIEPNRTIASSSSARRSDGRCASTRGWRPSGSAPTSTASR